MAARTSAVKRTTLYRFAEGTKLVEAVRRPPRGFHTRQVRVGHAAGLLVDGSFETPSKWAGDVSLLTDTEVSLRNQLPGAVLVVETSPNDLWALTWGIGFQLLETERIDFRFGSRIVARTALAREIKSITKTILDHRARTDRSSLPSGSTMWDLGVDGYGEVISRVDAKARIPGLTFGDKDIQLKAADSLSLPLAKNPDELVHDLTVLRDVLDQPVLPGLESVEQLVALKAKDPLVSQLNERLVNRLLGASDEPIGLSWPHERLDVYGPVVSCKATGFGDRQTQVFDGLPTIEGVLKWFTDLTPATVQHRLTSITLELHGEAAPTSCTAVSSPVKVRNWLTFEVRDGARRYCLHDGTWYRMDDQYLERIDERVEDILSQPAGITLPPWPSGRDEDGYNKAAAAAIGGYALDKKMIKTPLHSKNGFESCDIYVPPGILVHVKKGRGSDEVSHLLAQALVASESLARDEFAREAWTREVESASDGAISDPAVVQVVLAIGRKKPVTAQNLFTFSKVNLVRQYDLLRHLGVDVRVASIPI
ncbi:MULTISPECIES: DUF6119 family protein [unclassified Nocardia]|uniref:DUF6119 family protein n=1 Tax=unclassified Nocardia TaxID=2637762 RepID=UPI00278BDF6B|nr:MULTISPECIES: DUF6119 family protein [unclassified Nocardia]